MKKNKILKKKIQNKNELKSFQMIHIERLLLIYIVIRIFL